jgi:anti-sigma regulatory factor (Ser/Thr protein kinase)
VGGERNPDGRVRRRSLPPEPASPRVARELVREACRDWGVDEDMCEDAALVATELVANVVDHARTSCVVTVSQDDNWLRIEVEDLYPCSIPAPRPVDLTAQRGRGLQVIDGLSAAWGVRELPSGKSVWAILATD